MLLLGSFRTSKLKVNVGISLSGGIKWLGGAGYQIFTAEKKNKISKDLEG